MKQLITNNLATWTTAPNGIKKLRELILELAVRGLLVPQDPNDEPASALLTKIAAEKARLVSEGKIKQPKPLAKISEEEKPFDLPMGWEWVRLQDALDIRDGTHDSPKSEIGENTYPLVTSKDFYNGSINFETAKRISAKDHFEISKRSSVDKLDILFSMIGGNIGNQVIVNTDMPFSIKNVALFKYYSNKFTLPFYVKKFTEHLALNLQTKAAGGAQPFVGLGFLRSLVIALPPVNEQHRIVAKVDELMQLCDQLEQKQNGSQETHRQLVSCLLATLTEATDAQAFQAAWSRIEANFDCLFTTESSIEQLKQTILQLAVMGKLVPQNPDDEPANKLLEKMNFERNNWLNENKANNDECSSMLRKLRKLTKVKPPFLIPKTWECVSLIQITRMLVDCHNKTAPYVNNGIPIIRTSNIRNGRFRMVDVRYVDDKTYKYWARRCFPEPRDIIFTREAPMGEAAIIPEGATFCLGQRTMLIRPMHDYIINEYLLLALTEPHLLERASKHAIGSTVKHLRVGDVENLNIPIPPLPEQHRIVAKVDELMTLCEQLKTKLATAQTLQQQLAETLVQQAVA